MGVIFEQSDLSRVFIGSEDRDATVRSFDAFSEKRWGGSR